jgi:hypothetical protein
MRSSAKWILAAAAVVGAALLGSSPLAGAGKIHSFGPAVAAYLGLLIGLTGVGWAIWFTADALIPPLTTPRSLDTDPRLRDLRTEIAKDPAAFFGPFGTTMTELATASAFHQRVATNLRTAAASERDNRRRQTLEANLTEATAAARSAELRVQSLVELSHAWRVRAQMRRARVHTLVGAAVAAAGIVIFLAATSTTPPSSSVPTPAVTNKG